MKCEIPLGRGMWSDDVCLERIRTGIIITEKNNRKNNKFLYDPNKEPKCIVVLQKSSGPDSCERGNKQRPSGGRALLTFTPRAYPLFSVPTVYLPLFLVPLSDEVADTKEVDVDMATGLVSQVTDKKKVTR